MPESPCVGCKELVLHTDDDADPMCEQCAEKLMWWKIIMDIAEGKIKIQRDEQGRPIVPGIPGP